MSNQQGGKTCDIIVFLMISQQILSLKIFHLLGNWTLWIPHPLSLGKTSVVVHSEVRNYFKTLIISDKSKSKSAMKFT